MMETEIIEKVYWGIGEIAEELCKTTSGIRFWCWYFDIKPHRNNHNNRRFNAEEVEKLRRIKCLVVDEGYTLEGAKRKLVAEWNSRS